MSKSPLKECPFCRGDPEPIYSTLEPGKAYLQCSNCKMETANMDIMELVSFWNTRP